MSEPTSDDERWLLDQPRTHEAIFWGLVLAFVAFLLADFGYHKHPEYDFEGWFGFFSIFGVVAYLGLVAVATGLGVLLRREEDYYDE